MKVAIIPARGGSKRIPGKNIRLFCGKPIIGYSIEVAVKSGLFDRVIVSTDDDEIAQVAREYGAETPFIRPKPLADDFTGTNAVVKHAVEWLNGHQSAVRYVCCIYATAPLLLERYLREGFDKLTKTGKSFAFSVTSFPFPIQRAVYINEEGAVEAFYPEFMQARSQDLKEAYHDAGQFYWGRAEAYLLDIPLFAPTSVPVVIPRYLAQDIDTLEDWHIAEMKYKALHSTTD